MLLSVFIMQTGIKGAHDPHTELFKKFEQTSAATRNDVKRFQRFLELMAELLSIFEELTNGKHLTTFHTL